jgi:hypothetical protein
MWRFLAACWSSIGASSDRFERAWEGSIPFLGRLMIAIGGRPRDRLVADRAAGPRGPWGQAQTRFASPSMGDAVSGPTTSSVGVPPFLDNDISIF